MTTRHPSNRMGLGDAVVQLNAKSWTIRNLNSTVFETFLWNYQFGAPIDFTPLQFKYSEVRHSGTDLDIGGS